MLNKVLGGPQRGSNCNKDLNAVKRSPIQFSGPWDVLGIEKHHHKGTKNMPATSEVAGKTPG